MLSYHNLIAHLNIPVEKKSHIQLNVKDSSDRQDSYKAVPSKQL